MLTVADTGPGIPPEILPKIIQAYYSTTGPKPGTGLGRFEPELFAVDNAADGLHLDGLLGVFGRGDRLVPF